MSLKSPIDSKCADETLAAEIAAFRRSVSSVSTVGSLSVSGSESQDPQLPKDELRWKDVYKGDITEHHLEEIKNQLGLIDMSWDKMEFCYSLSQYPDSYISNSEKEKLLLWLVGYFRRKFNQEFPRRRPLLLACNNECAVQKMVCTFIRPTSLRYTELQNYALCASFVSDYVQYIPLINVSGLPDQLVSPSEVFARQNGHCFEMATLLASLLIGASYRAFVVSGYATREICVNDTSRTECPYLISEKAEEAARGALSPSKYELEPPRDLRSQFLLGLEEKEKAREAAAKRAQDEAEIRALKEFESPPSDPLWNHRRHAWVLVLPSKDLEEACFLEPASGTKRPVSDPEYLGIDSIWNHENYWVAVGKDREVACKGLNFDLNDPKCWRSFLPGERADGRHNGLIDESDESFENRMDMPASWTSNIVLTHADYERRYVDCHKTVQYRKCVVELLAPYSDLAGLVTRVTHFTDYDCTKIREVRQAYRNRADSLYLIHQQGDMQHHRFRRGRGRHDALTEHKFKNTHRGLATDLEMEFNPKSRHDHLYKLKMQPEFLDETFKNREDFLQNRHTIFGDAEQIMKLTETFNRDPSKPNLEDPATIEYDFQDDKVLMVHHYGEEEISAARRELCLATMKQVACYTPIGVCPLRPADILSLLQQCALAKSNAESNVRKRQLEVKEILVRRARELAEPKLLISLFDQDRNEDAKERYKERDRKLREEKERSLSLEVDLLAPYIAQLAEEEVTMPLSADKALYVYTKCLQDWKNVLLLRAVDMERQIELLREELKCTDKGEDVRGDGRLFQLHCLRVRLMRHRELAPQRYLAIDACLRAHSRLNNAFA